MTREEKIMQRVKEHYFELEKRIKDNGWTCKIFGLFLQGSQNYNLDEYSDEYMSDVDTKAIVIPSLRDLIYGKEYSTTLVLDNDEHIDVKDFRTMVTMFKKQNTSYLELLFTDFRIINEDYNNEWNALFEIREKIARMDKARHAQALTGSMHNKFKAMTHISPHNEDKIAKFGYDPKELCHIIRYFSELQRFIEDKDLKYMHYLLGETPEDDAYLMRVKKGIEFKDNAQGAIELATRLDSEMKELCDKFVATNPPKDFETERLLEMLFESTLVTSVRKELDQ